MLSSGHDTAGQQKVPTMGLHTTGLSSANHELGRGNYYLSCDFGG